ncbi:MAG: hypothetical protein U0X20_07315 [Caldilineaceae bacterium]
MPLWSAPACADKTSLLKLVLGSLRPAHSDITVNGQRVDGSPAGGVAYVPQVETVDWNFPVTVEQVVLMGRVRKSGIWPWLHPKISAWCQVLERAEIAPLAGRHIRNLSGGVAAACLHSPAP